MFQLQDPLGRCAFRPTWTGRGRSLALRWRSRGDRGMNGLRTRVHVILVGSSGPGAYSCSSFQSRRSDTGLRTIGQLARDSGVSVDTIRYYERIGLLPRRLAGGTGWRRYPDATLVLLRYLREGRAVGFTIRELRDLLRVSVAGAPRFCESFDAAVRRKIGSIDEIAARLAAQRALLEEFSRGCRERRSEQRCPMLERLHPHPVSANRPATPLRGS